MRKALVPAIAVLAAMALVGSAAASVPGKKAPVKLSGDVTNKGTAKVKNSKIDLEVDDFYFKPTFFQSTKGDTVTVKVENEGSVQHTFTIPKQDIDETIDPGSSVTVEVQIPSNGKPVTGFCRFHKGSGMQFAFFTKKGAKASSGGSSVTGNSGGSGS